jgi:cyclic beta-1,2-glucan synthetase
MGLEGQALAFRQQAESLRSTLETTAWDGRWYLRGYYDDGAPLGSSRDQEWRIDSVAQSWSVLSGAGDQGRARLAMQAAVAQLVRPDEGLILLATPPFDKGPSDPGYIKGYPPGVRENGGNYTHAAVWTVWALLELGLADLAVGLYRSLNPVHRANTAERMEQYRVEPYVVAADICGIPPQAGRGGWTWYTGSAAWMYRLGLEGILGLRRTSEGLEIDPCIPSAWPGYQIEFRHGRTPYHVEVMNPGGVCRGVAHVRLDGQELPGKRVPLLADARSHAVEVLLG